MTEPTASFGPCLECGRRVTAVRHPWGYYYGRCLACRPFTHWERVRRWLRRILRPPTRRPA